MSLWSTSAQDPQQQPMDRQNFVSPPLIRRVETGFAGSYGLAVLALCVLLQHACAQPPPLSSPAITQDSDNGSGNSQVQAGSEILPGPCSASGAPAVLRLLRKQLSAGDGVG